MKEQEKISKKDPLEELIILKNFIARKKALVLRLKLIPTDSDLDKLERLNDEFNYFISRLSVKRYKLLSTIINKF